MHAIPVQIQAWIDEQLDQAPDLTPQQRRRIGRILAGEIKAAS